MKIYQPLWKEGVFLTPEQFQQQALWEEYSNQQSINSVFANPWGITTLNVEPSLLIQDRLQLNSLAVRFPDGTIIDTDVTDVLPPARDLKKDIPSDVDDVTVFVGIPVLRTNGANCRFNLEEQTRLVRYYEDWVEVTDVLGDNTETISIKRHNVKILFDFEDNSEYVSCPIAKLKRDLNGKFVLDLGYLPPALNLTSQSGYIQQELEMLCLQVKSKRQRLMGMRHERNQQIAEFAVADVSLFWLLNAINSFEPQLKFFTDNLTLHPECLYKLLSSFTGALLTFSLEYDVDRIPMYKHDDLNSVFPPLFDLMKRLLEESLPSRVVKIDLEYDNKNQWIGYLNDARLTEEADFYLSVTSSMPAHQIQTTFPLLCKAGAPDDVNQIINSALLGIPIKALAHVPAAIPVRLNNQYFALDLNNEAAKNMLIARCCTFYVPRSLTNLSLELFAVLQA